MGRFNSSTGDSGRRPGKLQDKDGLPFEALGRFTKLTAKRIELWEVAQTGVRDFNSSVVVMMGVVLVVSMSVPSGCEMERLPQAAQCPAVRCLDV